MATFKNSLNKRILFYNLEAGKYNTIRVVSLRGGLFGVIFCRKATNLHFNPLDVVATKNSSFIRWVIIKSAPAWKIQCSVPNQETIKYYPRNTGGKIKNNSSPNYFTPFLAWFQLNPSYRCTRWIQQCILWNLYNSQLTVLITDLTNTTHSKWTSSIYAIHSNHG